MLKYKEHSKPTPPKEKPGWLRRGIASLAAFATLATGGLVAVSSANAIDNSGNGVIIGGGGNTGIGPNDFVLWLKDNLAQTAAGKPPTGWGTRDNANTSVLLSDLAKAGVDVSDSGVNKPLIQKACNQAVNRALDATHQRARGLASPPRCVADSCGATTPSTGSPCSSRNGLMLRRSRTAASRTICGIGLMAT